MAWKNGWLESFFLNLSSRKEEKIEVLQKRIKYEALTPLHDIDDKASFEALDFALKQDNIHNIAITGNYGAGKSSIINSYFKDRLKTDCLRLSLATFVVNERVPNENGNISGIGEIPNITKQEIEKSILQQIFYKKPGSAFPFSRFNRIKNYSKKTVFTIEFIVILIMTMGIKIIRSDWWDHFKKCITMQYTFFSFVLSILVVFALIISTFFIIRFFCRIKLTKFSFVEAEFGLGDINNESLLNKYLDELLYFFEITSYKIVIFEDLDRFENSEIFIKLRELNTIINNYERIYDKVVFIYALRDEVFTDSSRTKFFDFIIPVIPVINCQNSMDILLRKQKENEGTALSYVEEEFLQDVGLYIDDMRLLTNCINEFRIYDEKINQDYYKNQVTEPQKQTKIFAMVIFKNLYPKDFAELTQNRGVLYSIINSKNDLIKEDVKELNAENIRLNEYLEKIKIYASFSIEQLRRSYIEAILEGNTTYIATNKIGSLLSDEAFSILIKKQSIDAIYNSSYNSGSTTISFDWDEIQKKVNPLFSYDEGEQYIKGIANGKVQSIKKSISENKIRIDNLNTLSIQNFSSFEALLDEKITEESKMNKDFIRYLLVNKYIDEDYFEYISYFYPESLSRNDKQFLLLIKNNKKPDFILRLDNPKNVIKRIRLNEWKNEAILNNSLATYILDHNDRKQVKNFIQTMYFHDCQNLESQFYSQYQDSNINITNKLDNALNEFIKANNSGYDKIFNYSNYDKFFRFFLYINDFSNENYINFIKHNLKFLYRVMSKEQIDKVNKQLIALQIKFNLDNEIAKYPLYKIIVDNNLYEITKENLQIIINTEENTHASINDIFTKTSKLNTKEVKEYLYKDIMTSVENIIIKNKNNINESEEILIELLNNLNIDLNQKKCLIENNKTLLSDVTFINQFLDYEDENGSNKFNIWNYCFQINKIKPSWHNIITAYNDEDNVDILINYINKNYNKLQGDVVILNPDKDDKNSALHKKTVNIFSKLLSCNDLSLLAYKMIASKSPWRFTRIDSYNIDKEHVKILCKSKKLTLSETNYKEIKNIDSDSCNLLIAENFDELFKIDISFIPQNYLIDLINKNILSSNEKIKLASSDIIDWSSVSNNECISTIADIIIREENHSKILIDLNLLLTTQKIENAILLLILQIDNYTKDEIIKGFKELEKPYSEIIDRGGKEIQIQNNLNNKMLCSILEKKKLISSYYINKAGKLKIRRLR